jgi:UDP-N-acetylmuramoyl-L-alanyl-D-glutamate--2,6-diaminopimelate ligase
MEVSSHSVVQKRIAGLEFAGGVFTNITHDHLDYHKTFDEYIKAKKGFFDSLNKDAFALTNIDDRNGNVMLRNSRAKTRTYSLQKMADFRAKVMLNEFSGLEMNIDGNDVWCRLIGRFNAYNILAIYASAVLLGEEKTKVLTILSGLNPVEGRFECFRSEGNITSVVDYAHTPDALSNVINTILNIRKPDEKLITVVGCGGDRDRAKRPVMAGIASQYSDMVILTSDNPRSEVPEMIIDEMEKGVEKYNSKKVLKIVNRKDALKVAVSLAKPGDIILVAGKGHETYQEIKGVKYPFDDRKIIKEIMNMQINSH